MADDSLLMLKGDIAMELGSAVMSLVGGGRLAHGVPFFQHLLDAEIPLKTIAGMALYRVTGLTSGAMSVVMSPLRNLCLTEVRHFLPRSPEYS